MKTVLTALLLLTVNLAWAQPDSLWSRTYGGIHRDCCLDIIQKPDDGYILAGVYDYGHDDNRNDFFLLNTNAIGEEQWSQTYGGMFYDECYSLLQTSDNGYLLVGATRSFGEGYKDGYVVKVDSVGEEEWSRTYGTELYDATYNIAPAGGDGYVVAGYTGEPHIGGLGTDMYLVRIDSEGEELWSRTYGGRDDESCNDIIQAFDCGFVLVGVSDYDFYIVRTDSLGEEQWLDTYGGVGTEECTGII